jgi:hypothetical protein
MILLGDHIASVMYNYSIWLDYNIDVIITVAINFWHYHSLHGNKNVVIWLDDNIVLDTTCAILLN